MNKISHKITKFRHQSQQWLLFKVFITYYAPPLIGGGIKGCFCLTSVCLSVAYIGPNSTKIGSEVAHVTCHSDTTFKVKRSSSSGRFGCMFKSMHNLYR